MIDIKQFFIAFTPLNPLLNVPSFTRFQLLKEESSHRNEVSPHVPYWYHQQSFSRVSIYTLLLTTKYYTHCCWHMKSFKALLLLRQWKYNNLLTHHQWLIENLKEMHSNVFYGILKFNYTLECHSFWKGSYFWWGNLIVTNLSLKILTRLWLCSCFR